MLWENNVKNGYESYDFGLSVVAALLDFKNCCIFSFYKKFLSFILYYFLFFQIMYLNSSTGKSSEELKSFMKCFSCNISERRILHLCELWTPI